MKMDPLPILTARVDPKNISTIVNTAKDAILTEARDNHVDLISIEHEKVDAWHKHFAKPPTNHILREFSKAMLVGGLPEEKESYKYLIVVDGDGGDDELTFAANCVTDKDYVSLVHFVSPSTNTDGTGSPGKSRHKSEEEAQQVLTDLAAKFVTMVEGFDESHVSVQTVEKERSTAQSLVQQQLKPRDYDMVIVGHRDVIGAKNLCEKLVRRSEIPLLIAPKFVEAWTRQVEDLKSSPSQVWVI
jgi:nucleotide-binding universal stress UspA family protein